MSWLFARANPTDRGKKETKRNILTDGKGIPLSVTVDGANFLDKKLVKETLDAIIFERPSPDNIIQNICMDKRIMIFLISFRIGF